MEKIFAPEAEDNQKSPTTVISSAKARINLKRKAKEQSATISDLAHQ